MATTTKSKKDFNDLYDGFDVRDVGVGTIDPSIYATKSYTKKKQQKIILGGLNLITYAGWDHDANPLILTMGYVPAYNVVISYNLHYVPYQVRKAIIDFVIKSNVKNIKNNKPMVVDYHALKRAVPVSPAIVRMYKVVAIRVVETYPLNSWGTAISDKSKWQNHYKTSKSNESTLQKFIRSVKSIVGR